MAGATVENVNILFKAQTGDLRKGVDAAQNKVKDLGKTVDKTGDKMEASFSKSSAFIAGGLAAMGAAAVRAAKDFAKFVLDFQGIDELAKTSQKLGMTTEAVASLNHAAGLTGAGAEAMEKGLLKMVKATAEAANGAGAARGALEELGLDAKELAASSPEQQFYMIADAMETVENSNDKVKLAMQLFGKAGADLIPTMMGGSEALKEYAKDAERLGLTIDTQSAASVEAANDAWDQMTLAMKGIGNSIIGFIAPVIKGVANLVTEVLVIVRKFVEKYREYTLILEFAVDNMQKAWDFALATMAARLVQWGDNIKGTFVNIGNNLAEFGTQLKSLFSGGSFEFSWDTLAGFEESDLAKNLKAERDKLALELATGFEKFKADRLAKQLLPKDSIDLEDAINDESLKGLSAKIEKQIGGTSGPQFIAAGSEAYAQMIIQAASRDVDKQRRDKELAAAERTAKHLEKMLKLQERLDKKRNKLVEVEL